MSLSLRSAWALLSLATLVSWGLDASGTAAGVGTLVLLVAFWKARLVLLVFMELADSKPVLRRLCEAWVLLAASVVIATYWLAPRFAPVHVASSF